MRARVRTGGGEKRGVGRCEVWKSAHAKAVSVSSAFRHGRSTRTHPTSWWGKDSPCLFPCSSPPTTSSTHS
eukprot:224710-Chlamydomonas_euryale.AAC.1